MLSGPQRKFCDGIVKGLKKGAAYRAAYPDSTPRAASASACDLLKNPNIEAEIQRLRAKADEKAGSAVLTLMEKRMKLARIVRAKPSDASEDNEDCETVMTKAGPFTTFPDKLAAIKLDNDLAGEGSEAGAQDEIAAMLARLNARKK